MSDPEPRKWCGREQDACSLRFPTKSKTDDPFLPFHSTRPLLDRAQSLSVLDCRLLPIDLFQRHRNLLPLLVDQTLVPLSSSRLLSLPPLDPESRWQVINQIHSLYTT
jgi:hypothetical protein